MVHGRKKKKIIIIIRNGAKTISLPNYLGEFGRFNNDNNKKKRSKNNKSPKLCLGDLITKYKII